MEILYNLSLVRLLIAKLNILFDFTQLFIIDYYSDKNYIHLEKVQKFHKPHQKKKHPTLPPYNNKIKKNAQVNNRNPPKNSFHLHKISHPKHNKSLNTINNHSSIY
jgi:hypothetical protein